MPDQIGGTSVRTEEEAAFDLRVSASEANASVHARLEDTAAQRAAGRGGQSVVQALGSIKGYTLHCAERKAILGSPVCTP